LTPLFSESQKVQLTSLPTARMVAGSNVEIYEHDCLEDHFQKFLTLGDDRNIEQVYVRGLRVL
jgi:hypothetical protein